MRTALALALLAAAPAAQPAPCVEVFGPTRTQPFGIRWNDAEVWDPAHVEFVPYAGQLAMLVVFDNTIYKPWCNEYLWFGPGYSWCPRLGIEMRAFWWWEFYPQEGERMWSPLQVDIFRVRQGMAVFTPPAAALVPIVNRLSKANPVTQPTYWAALLTPQGGSW